MNKVETAVRIVHLPTGLAVRCTQERSQLQNKEKAMTLLKAKLMIIAQEQRASQIADIRGDIVRIVAFHADIAESTSCRGGNICCQAGCIV